MGSQEQHMLYAPGGVYFELRFDGFLSVDLGLNEQIWKVQAQTKGQLVLVLILVTLDWKYSYFFPDTVMQW